MASSIATAYIQLVPSFQGAQGSITEGLIKEAGPAAEKAGKSSGMKFSAGLLAAGAVVAGAAATLVGGAKALYSIGDTFNEVHETIRVGTGATGEALAGLEQVARNVGTTIPASFEAAGSTVADINTRLGLSGQTLETVASQYLEAGRILGEEVDINATSAAFSAFRIEGDAVSGAMDTLFRVSQATGVGMNQLASSAQAAAPAMNMLGFSFEETVGLVGMLDKAGMNSTQTMAAMQRSLVNLAKDGEEPADAFQRVIGELEGFIEAGDNAAALDLAGQVFGTRGAPQFIAALESGKLATEDIMAAMGATGDTILGLGAETMNFSESWQVFKNNALSALEPVGTALFNGLGGAMATVTELAQEYGPMIGDFLANAMDRVAPILDTVLGLFGELGPVISELAPPILEAVTAVSPFGLILKTLQPLMPALTGALRQLGAVFTGVLATVLPVITGLFGQLAGLLSGALMTILPILVSTLTTVAEVFGAVLTALMPVVSELLDALIPVVFSLIETLMPLIGAVLPVLADLLLALLPAISPVVQIIASLLVPIVKVLGAVLTWLIKSVLVPVIKWITSVATSMSSAGRTIKSVWDGIRNALNTAWSWIKTNVFQPISTWVGNIPGWFTSMKDRVSSNFSALKELLAAPWRWVRDNVFAKLKTTVDNIPGAFRSAKESIKTAWNGIKAIAAAPVNFVIQTVYMDGIKATFDKIAGAVGLSLRLPSVSPIRFADGSEDHRAQIASPGAMRLWAEPETGGEAYIPLSSRKRTRSTQILGTVAQRFGYNLVPFADGGFWGGVGNFFSGAIDTVKEIADFLSDPITGLKDAITAPMEKLLDTVGGGYLGQMLVELPRRVVTSLIDKAVGLLSPDEGSGPLSPGGWVRPSRGPITSRFGPRTMFGNSFHAGIDIAGGGKTFAARAGKVLRTGNAILAGHTGLGILIDHGGGVQTYYGHNPVGGIQVSPGQMVRAGQHIGFQGATGNVTGVHLHFGLRKGGRMVNPEQIGVFDDGGRIVPGVNVVDNRSGKPEALLNSRQWQLAEAALAGAASSGRLDRADLDYLADRIIQGLAGLARSAGYAGDMARTGRLKAQMAGVRV